MFREMRRKKQALGEKECIEILERGNMAVIALAGDDDYPYTVPVNYVYSNGKIYFHCAKSGHKLDAIRRNSKVSICVVDRNVLVPEEYTTYFSSVIAFGRASIMEDKEEIMDAIIKLCLKYVPNDTEEGRNSAIKREIEGTCLVAIDIEHLSGKEAIEWVRAREKQVK